jgi:cysteine-rich repeat protein
MNAALNQEGLIDLPTNVNGGNPFCEDYNEQMLCGSASNTNACPTMQAAGLGVGYQTTCGNGIVEQFEDCDLGAALNGTAGASCSNICRNTN